VRRVVAGARHVLVEMEDGHILGTYLKKRMTTTKETTKNIVLSELKGIPKDSIAVDMAVGEYCSIVVVDVPIQSQASTEKKTVERRTERRMYQHQTIHENENEKEEWIVMKSIVVCDDSKVMKVARPDPTSTNN